MGNYGPGDIRNTENIPAHLLSDLQAYEETGRATGKCLRSMLANDYFDAVLIGANKETLRAIPAIILYIYNDMTSQCHGSYKVYEAWRDYAFFKSQLPDIVSIEDGAELRRLKDGLDEARSFSNHREGAYE